MYQCSGVLVSVSGRCGPSCWPPGVSSYLCSSTACPQHHEGFEWLCAHGSQETWYPHALCCSSVCVLSASDNKAQTHVHSRLVLCVCCMPGCCVLCVVGFLMLLQLLNPPVHAVMLPHAVSCFQTILGPCPSFVSAFLLRLAVMLVPRLHPGAYRHRQGPHILFQGTEAVCRTTTAQSQTLLPHDKPHNRPITTGSPTTMNTKPAGADNQHPLRGHSMVECT